jgi:5'-3' exoribonuclease 1
MGIPSYFSYIIKKHSKIVKPLGQHLGVNFSALFIDSNSIIYDVVHSMMKPQNNIATYNAIIDKVIENIYGYISIILPSKLTYIAFDGIAPFAKLEQQKTRRYKSAFLQQQQHRDEKDNKDDEFNTIMITPGTPFMNLLSERMITEFSLNTEIIVSTSLAFGEGEHKLCQYLRENPFPNQNIIIYGLDADLIMLALFHQGFAGNIFVMREKPNFISVINPGDKREEDNELLLLNTKELSSSIKTEMNCKDDCIERVFDYVFLCFFLGNDFLPSFPSLNIRTAGIQRLMDTYREHIGKYNNRRFLSKDGEILWKWVHLFIKELAKNERTFWIQEYEVRNKWEYQTRKRLNTERNTLDEWINNVPVLFREIEHYISPQMDFWEKRYYDSLLGGNEIGIIERKKLIKEISINYLEGLEWVYYYYTKGCINTQWKYNYNYPPLLMDLVEFTPTIEHSFLKKNDKKISQKEQLEYIIPSLYWESLGLSPIHKKEITPKFSWSFKRYFWEAHIDS